MRGFNIIPATVSIVVLRGGNIAAPHFPFVKGCSQQDLIISSFDMLVLRDFL